MSTVSSSRVSKTRAARARRDASAPERASLPFEKTIEVRDRCLCLFVQRAARALARRFDEAFRPLSLTHGQFSLLTSLNRPSPPIMGDVAALLGMDRTTLTAALKSLIRRGLVKVRPDSEDLRSRRLLLTPAGASLLAKAYPVWNAAHAALEATCADSARLRGELAMLESCGVHKSARD
jgi:DNA-binding MarR family transcriptional regulator